MIEPRLASHLLVSALVRRANATGDFATVVRKGDEIAGALLVVGREKGRFHALFERFPALDGGLKWSEIPGQGIDNEEELEKLLANRRARDPDLWIIDLDVAFTERLAGLLP